uniref:Uncharacterized protein n=1 Tax=Solanum tuberosum TaxID=4113 RepID=M1D8L3_SOLTU
MGLMICVLFEVSKVQGSMSSIASDPCDCDMADYDCDDEGYECEVMVIMGDMIIAMIKNRMGMRATIPEENMREMVNIAPLVRMEKKHLVVAPMVMREHARGLTLTLRVKMVPMMIPEHVTLPTPRIKVRSCIGLVDSRGKAPNTLRKYPPVDMGRIEEPDEVQVCAKGVHKAFQCRSKKTNFRTKVGIYGALRLDLVIDDGYNLNYITPEVVAYLGLPRLQRTYPYTMEGCKVTEGVKKIFLANLKTFTIANEQSVNVRLSLCEPIDSLPCVDNVLVENVDTLIDPIDDRIDSSMRESTTLTSPYQTARGNHKILMLPSLSMRMTNFYRPGEQNFAPRQYMIRLGPSSLDSSSCSFNTDCGPNATSARGSSPVSEQTKGRGSEDYS